MQTGGIRNTQVPVMPATQVVGNSSSVTTAEAGDISQQQADPAHVALASAVAAVATAAAAEALRVELPPDVAAAAGMAAAAVADAAMLNSVAGPPAEPASAGAADDMAVDAGATEEGMYEAVQLSSFVSA
jgi:hypothetical protein